MTDIFTAIDLSRLPRPTVIDPVSFDTFYAEMKAAALVVMPDLDFSIESDPVTKLTRLFAGFRVLDRQRANDDAVARLLAFAGGADLDHLGALVGVKRLVLVAAHPENNVAEVLEGDDPFRERIVIGPERYSVAGPQGAYIFHAREAHPDVLDASAISPAPGEVLVSVLSRVGNGQASEEVLEAVRDRLNNEDVRPMTDFVTVQSAEIVNYNIQATIRTYAGPDSSIVLAAAQARAAAYAEAQHRIGRDITPSGIFAALHVDGVQKVVLAAPAEVVISRTQASWCTSIDVTQVGIGE